MDPALAASALEAFRTGHISKPELRRLLGLETRYELDEFLKAHEVHEDYTLADVEEEVQTLKRLGV